MSPIVDLLARIWVLFGAVLTFGLGILYAIDPAAVEPRAGILLPTPAALSEIRSTYGGLHIGLGLYLFQCSLSPLGRQFGLLLCGLAFLFAGIARVGGVAQFGAELPQLVLAALEFCFGAGALLIRSRIGRSAVPAN